MDFRLLGPLEVYDKGESLHLGSPKQRALLALLLLRANEVVSRETAIDALWDEEPPERAAQSLQVYVHGLRKALGRERIELRGTGYVLHVAGDELDLQRFERLVTLGEFDAALRLWRGEPLADVALHVPERARLAELRLHALELDADRRLAAGEGSDLVPQLEALVAEHPLREPFSRQLMLALYRSGRQAEALEVFRATRRVLDEELGLEPSPAFAELERSILLHDPTLQPAGTPRTTLRLPTPATALVGRDLDVASVCAQLRGDARLVTLTGPGGIGKTRLGIEAASVLGSELSHGATFVDLAPITAPENVGPAIAAAVGAAEAPGQSVVDSLVARLGPLETVLLLDNFERLLNAAPLVADLLARTPRLRILATSRAPLRVAAEREYAVQAIDVTDDAVAIFVNRARAADPEFVTTAEVAAICVAVEGLPLAIELAAARVRILTPAQLLQRLSEPLALLSGGGRDLPARQQALRATIDWSYELLDAEAQELFAKLAVFAGGSTLEAAENVCDAELEALTALLDSSLLRRTPSARFRMLDTVRQYALELDAGDVRDRHARYFTELAERLGPELIGPRRVVAMSEVAAEHDNLLAALAFDVERGFRIVAALRSYWTTATRGREIQAWLEGAFAAADSVGTESRIGALLVLGRQLMNQGEYDVARVTLERVVAAAKELDCWSVASTALGYLAWLSAVAHDDEGCRQLAEEAIELGRRGSDRWAERQGLAMVAATLIDRGEYAAAMDYLSESLAIARELDDPSTTVLALVNRSYGAIAAGDHALARPLLEEALELARGLDEPPSMVSVLHLLAWEASVARDPERTRRFLHDALELLQAGGRTSQIVDVLSETALALEASDPETAARLLAAADASAPARGIPATERYGPLRERLAGHSATAVAPHDAVRDALVALD